MRSHDPSGTRVILSPFTRVLWRSASSVQLELGSRRVCLDGVDRSVVAGLLGDRSGPPPRTASAASAPSAGVTVDDETARALLPDSFVWHADGPRRAVDGLDERLAPPHPRLQPELAALAAQYGPDAAAVLARRGQARVVVSGPGALGPLLVALLAAAGVGHVGLADSRPARLYHVRPGGAGAAEEGTPLEAVAAGAARRVAADTDTLPAFGVAPDLVVLVEDEPVDDVAREALHRRGCAHLLVSSTAARAVVGPLVLPGHTCCLRCMDLHRLDRDPAWNALAVQLTRPVRGAVGGDAATGSMAAGLAVGQALQHLDGADPTVCGGTLELNPPDWRVRRRSWLPHPDCDCAHDQRRSEHPGRMAP